MGTPLEREQPGSPDSSKQSVSEQEHSASADGAGAASQEEDDQDNLSKEGTDFDTPSSVGESVWERWPSPEGGDGSLALRLRQSCHSPDLIPEGGVGMSMAAARTYGPKHVDAAGSEGNGRPMERRRIWSFAPGPGSSGLTYGKGIALDDLVDELRVNVEEIETGALTDRIRREMEFGVAMNLQPRVTENLKVVAVQLGARASVSGAETRMCIEHFMCNLTTELAQDYMRHGLHDEAGSTWQRPAPNSQNQ